ncbi:uncharacterized protein LOC130111721 [Lampris incognitus]|uniref:uncharacterized protein LOC130111721 n=1 Tax=Lampris incognitus TaxID=2546036 RepID=UPI0024B52036|nr:uncharacterized protein LOC130111721 [Lampris incognitus]
MDGSKSTRFPLTARRGKRSLYGTTIAYPWWWYSPTTMPPAATANPYHTTPQPTPVRSWWWWHTLTATPPSTMTTTPLPTTTRTPYWWWWHTTTTTTTPPSTTTTTTPPTTIPYWWWHTTTTTTPPSTTTTTPRPTTIPYWWWHTTTTTTPPSTTTTTTRPTTTPYWWWWLHTTTTTTTTPPTTTTTTSLPTTTTTPWWYTTTTTPPPTTTTTATTTISTPWWWQQHSTTTHRLTTTTRGTRSTTGHPHAATPLSKLPLHFSFSVDPPAPSCHEGEFLPRFLPPTPRHGEQLHAEVNKEMQIRIKAQATRATLDNVIMSGPLNISKQKTTRDEFIIKWTPVPDDLGERFPVCFAVESLVRTRVYQSEMRCVVVSVGRGQVKANVICYETSMRVEVAKSSLEGLSADHLRLSDPSNTACSFRSHSNTTHVVAVIPLNACGTQIEEDNENLIFKNEITTFDNPNDIITRKHLLEVEFYCQYPKRGNVSTGFTAHRNNVTVKERGFGTFTYQLEFYHSNRFRTVIDPNSYPLEFDIGDEIYMEIEATSSVNNTELFVESCRAAPYDNPNYRPTYSIIENGCAVDKTVEIYSPRHNNHFMFGMEAFKFIGLHDQVYISCAIILCEAGNPNTRCSRGCINSTSPLSHRHISKREAVIQTSSHFISQGPLRLRRASESTVTSINLNLVFIVGCLLAAVAMVCGVVISKGKMSRVSYQRLPNFET